MTWKLVFGIIVTTVAWVAVTYLTKPEDEHTLIGFCRKVHPGGPGWKKIEAAARAAGAEVESDPGGWNVPVGLLCMMVGCLMIWTALFGVGYLLYGRALLGWVMVAISAASVWALAQLMRKLHFS